MGSFKAISKSMGAGVAAEVVAVQLGGRAAGLTSIVSGIGSFVKSGGDPLVSFVTLIASAYIVEAAFLYGAYRLFKQAPNKWFAAAAAVATLSLSQMDFSSLSQPAAHELAPGSVTPPASPSLPECRIITQKGCLIPV